jgi:GH25 family lysozyme M1 (1,4-beta-N-acetylmuramidase)
MPAVLNQTLALNFFLKIQRVIFLLSLLTLTGTEVFAQRPLGTDVSHWQTSVNWTAVKNAGVTFCWAKATQGDTITDSMFTSHAAGARSVGIYFGAYHYAQPSLNTNLTGANSAESEAAYFWGVVSNYVKLGGTNLVPMLDWEDIHATNNYNGFNGFTTSYMSQWVVRWCNTVSNYAQAAGVTLKPIIYTGVWYSQPNSQYPGLNTTVTGWPAWISAYNGQPHQTGGPSSSYPWSTWTVWQYADTNWSGGDSDVFNGTSSTIGSIIIGGLGAPVLTSQQFLQRAADTGSNVSFAVAASGGQPLKYQWRLNGTNVLNATNSVYNLTNAQTTNAGFYTVVVTNSSGSVTSTPVSLLVFPPQVTLFADNFDLNTAANWTQNKSSADTAATFNFDYSALGIPSAPNSTNNSTLGLQMQANLTLGVTNALSLSPSGQNFSGDYRLRFDAWINVNGPFPGGGAGSTEFLTAGIGTSGARTQWIGRSSTADGYYFSINGDGGSADTSTTTADVNAYIGTAVQAAATGVYWAGTDTSARGNGNVYYTTTFGSGDAAPALQQANYPANQTGNLNDGTFGLAWHDVIVSRRGSTVDWVVDGVRFCTISNATFTASNVFVGFWDPFNSLSANNAINFGLVDNVRVESPAAAPTWLTQPVAKTVKLGTNVTLTAAASGLPTPNFQWRFNGTNISGATNSSYAITFVAATNAGNYSVVASNFMGAITSTNAALALVTPVAAQFGTSSMNLGGGTLQISFYGDAYWTYTIEVSTNLTNWDVFTNLTSTNGVFNFNTGSIIGTPQQFFRARVGP